MASVAQITGTLIESGCKHIIPVRVSYDQMLAFSDGSSGDVFLRDKYKYCAHKDDLLMCVGTPLFSDKHPGIAGKQAYPPVVSNLGDLDPKYKALICLCNAIPAGETMDAWVVATKTAFNSLATEYSKTINKVDWTNDKSAHKLPDLRFMGFSCGLGYVHPSNGDTVVSSYIGGMITVRNGAFPIKTGDRVMFYHDFEAGFFDKDGRRIALTDNTGRNAVALSYTPSDVDKSVGEDRRNAQWRSNGWLGHEGAATNAVPNADSVNSKHGGKQNVSFVKPYIETSVLYPRDALRVFGIALGNARPWDQCDIKVSTQCS